MAKKFKGSGNAVTGNVRKMKGESKSVANRQVVGNALGIVRGRKKKRQ